MLDTLWSKDLTSASEPRSSTSGTRRRKRMNQGDDGSRGRVTRYGAHRMPRKRSVLSRSIAAGGAVVCIGAVYEITAPTAHAFSIVFRSPDGNGSINEVRV